MANRSAASAKLRVHGQRGRPGETSSARWLYVALCAWLAACDYSSDPAAEALKPNPKRASLTIYGYNYTDLYIDSFSVNGNGGGNLEVSIPTGGGGGHACCIGVIRDMQYPYKVQVKWTRDAKRWCEQEVTVTPPFPPDPKYFEVHFYPDGKIETAVTEQASSPRLKLERFNRGFRNETGNVNNDDKFSRCSDG
jgi:Protein of unknown function (DUF3304)